ncbi:hypothetical protein D3C75_913490 [compost metagenome]
MFAKALGGYIAARTVFVHGPVGQAADAAPGRNQLHHHHGKFRSTYLCGLDVGGVEEAGEDVQAGAFDRVGDQCLAGDIGGLQVRLVAHGVVVVDGQQCLVAEQRHVADTRQCHRVGGHHQVQVAALQGWQWREGKTRGEVQFHLRPGAAELIH